MTSLPRKLSGLVATGMGLYDRDYGRDEELTPWDRHQRSMSQSPKSITVILVIVTVAIHLIDLITASHPEGKPPESLLVEYFGCYKETLIKPWLWFQFLTYGFLHAQENIFHVGFNMFGLFIFGRAVEERMGRGEFLRFYLVSMFVGGVIGSLTYWAMGVSAGLVIGASGAVMAVTIMFACYYPHTNILLMMVFPVKAWIVAVVFVASNLLGSISMLYGQDQQDGGTAFTVHLAGIAFALLYHFQNWNLRFLDVSNYQGRVERSVRRTRLKIHDPDEKLRREEEDVDAILAKIHQSGEESLTRSERRTLEKHSRRQRERRNRS